MKGTLLKRLEDALKQSGPALHGMIKTLDDEGYSQMEILEAFYGLFDKVHEDELDEEDTVEEGIEMITGFCSPHLHHEFLRPYTQDEYDGFMRDRGKRTGSKISL